MMLSPVSYKDVIVILFMLYSPWRRLIVQNMSTNVIWNKEFDILHRGTTVFPCFDLNAPLVTTEGCVCVCASDLQKWRFFSPPILPSLQTRSSVDAEWSGTHICIGRRRGAWRAGSIICPLSLAGDGNLSIVLTVIALPPVGGASKGADWGGCVCALTLGPAGSRKRSSNAKVPAVS